jgi:hypothetical protein
MTRKSLHQGIVVAVLLLNNLALLVLHRAELREEMLKGRIHVDSALVARILEILVLDIRSNQLKCLLSANKEMLAVISQVVNNQDAVIVVEALVVLKKRLHLSSINGLQLLETLVAIGGAVLTALAALLVQALNITLKLADIGGSGAGSLNKGLKKGLALAGKLNKGVSLGLETADILGVNRRINNSSGDGLLNSNSGGGNGGGDRGCFYSNIGIGFFRSFGGAFLNKSAGHFDTI